MLGIEASSFFGCILGKRMVRTNDMCFKETFYVHGWIHINLLLGDHPLHTFLCHNIELDLLEPNRAQKDIKLYSFNARNVYIMMK